MTPYQRGHTTFHLLGWSPQMNPGEIGSVAWLEWRNGHNAAQVETSRARDRMAARATTVVGDHLPHGWEQR